MHKKIYFYFNIISRHVGIGVLLIANTKKKKKKYNDYARYFGSSFV